MIDREGRDRLALALRRYLAGRITNDDLAEVDVDWRDRGAVAVNQTSWHLYSDHTTYYARGSRAIPWQSRREVARWILFLWSNEEYLWPQYRLDVEPLFWRKRKRAQFLQAGDFAVWPFIDRASFDAARLSPRFFAHSTQLDLPFDGEMRKPNA